MKKRYHLPICFMVMMALLLLTACGSTQPANTTQSQTAADDMNATEEAGVIKLRASSPTPQEAPVAQGFAAYLDEIEKRTNGRVQFERYFGGSLIKPGDELDALGAGVADLAVFSPNYVPGKIPLATVVSNPGLWKTTWVGTMAVHELYETVPEMKKELAAHGLQLVGQWALSTFYVMSKNEIRSIDDLKGLKTVANGQAAVLAKELGANPVSMPVEELYEAIARGVADAVVYTPVEITTFGLTEEIKYIYTLPFGATAQLIAFNQNSWENLPEDIRDIILEIGARPIADIYHDIYYVQGIEASIQALLDRGAVIVEPSEADLAKLQEAVEKIWANWIQEQENKGLPGETVLNTLVELVKKYEQEYPYE